MLPFVLKFVWCEELQFIDFCGRREVQRVRSDENDDLWGDIFNLQHTVLMPIPTSND